MSIWATNPWLDSKFIERISPFNKKAIFTEFPWLEAALSDMNIISLPGTEDVSIFNAVNEISVKRMDPNLLGCRSTLKKVHCTTQNKDVVYFESIHFQLLGVNGTVLAVPKPSLFDSKTISDENNPPDISTWNVSHQGSSIEDILVSLPSGALGYIMKVVHVYAIYPYPDAKWTSVVIYKKPKQWDLDSYITDKLSSDLGKLQSHLDVIDNPEVPSSENKDTVPRSEYDWLKQRLMAVLWSMIEHPETGISLELNTKDIIEVRDNYTIDILGQYGPGVETFTLSRKRDKDEAFPGERVNPNEIRVSCPKCFVEMEYKGEGLWRCPGDACRSTPFPMKVMLRKK